jgi:hypothetical protein
MIDFSYGMRDTAVPISAVPIQPAQNDLLIFFHYQETRLGRGEKGGQHVEMQ